MQPLSVAVTKLLAAVSRLSTVVWKLKAVTTPSRPDPEQRWQGPDTQND